MANHTDVPTKENRLNVSITGDDVLIIEELRSLLEKRLQQRLSIAQVMRRLARYAVEAERALAERN